MSPPRLAFGFALALALALAAACRSHPAPTAAGAPPLDRAQCVTLASGTARKCGSDENDVREWCIAVGRLAEVAACAPQARRAYDCATRTWEHCNDAACCTSGIECDDVNDALDHCARGYCGGHSGNPDCSWTAQRINEPISLLSPPAPTSPMAPGSPTAPADPDSPADPEDDLAAALDAGIRKIDDTHYELRVSALDKILANPMAVAKTMRVVPSMKNGQPDGFKLYAIRQSSLWARLGFANGDTLQAINGLPLDSADKALEVYTALRNTKLLELDLVRRGAPLRLFITIRD